MATTTTAGGALGPEFLGERAPIGPKLAKCLTRRHTRRVTRTYTRAEADEILRRALAQQDADGINHEDLVAAAREVGIPADAIERAAHQLAEHGAVNTRKEVIRRRRRRAFWRHVLTYTIANAGIFAVDWLDGGPWFFYWPLIVWGVVLALIGLRQLAPDEESLTRRAERELEKERRRAERRKRRQARPPAPRSKTKSRVEEEFDAAVEAGVTAILSAVTRGIRGVTPGDQRYRVDDAPSEDESTGARDGRYAGRRR